MYYIICGDYLPNKDICQNVKILQDRLQQYMNSKPPDIKHEYRKARRTRDQIANICWIIEKAREFQKKASSPASLAKLKPLNMWITTEGNS